MPLLFGLGIALIACNVFLHLFQDKSDAPRIVDPPLAERDFYEPEPLPPMKPGTIPPVSFPPPVQEKTREPSVFPSPVSETEKARLMEEQVHALRVYAGLHGPEDPFSMTEEQIEAFRKKGNPFLE